MSTYCLHRLCSVLSQLKLSQRYPSGSRHFYVRRMIWSQLWRGSSQVGTGCQPCSMKQHDKAALP
jgi:hypothetical protein